MQHAVQFMKNRSTIQRYMQVDHFLDTLAFERFAIAEVTGKVYVQ